MTECRAPVRIAARRSTKLSAHEARMGEIAAILSDVADGLSEFPDALDLCPAGKLCRRRSTALRIDEAEWPSFEQLRDLINEWQSLQRGDIRRRD